MWEYSLFGFGISLDTEYIVCVKCLVADVAEFGTLRDHGAVKG